MRRAATTRCHPRAPQPRLPPLPRPPRALQRSSRLARRRVLAKRRAQSPPPAVGLAEAGAELRRRRRRRRVAAWRRLPGLRRRQPLPSPHHSPLRLTRRPQSHRRRPRSHRRRLATVRTCWLWGWPWRRRRRRRHLQRPQARQPARARLPVLPLPLPLPLTLPLPLPALLPRRLRRSTATPDTSLARAPSCLAAPAAGSAQERPPRRVETRLKRPLHLLPALRLRPGARVPSLRQTRRSGSGS